MCSHQAGGQPGEGEATADLLKLLMDRVSQAEQNYRDLQRRQRRFGLAALLLLPLGMVLSGVGASGPDGADVQRAEPAARAQQQEQLLARLPAGRRDEVKRFEEQVQWLGAYMHTLDGFDPGAAVALFLSKMVASMEVMPEMSRQMQAMNANMAAMPAILAELRMMNAQMAVISHSMDSTMGRAGAMMPWVPFGP